MIETFSKFLIIWLSISTIIFATGWYLATIISPYFPDWWKREVIDDDPDLW